MIRTFQNSRSYNKDILEEEVGILMSDNPHPMQTISSQASGVIEEGSETTVVESDLNDERQAPKGEDIVRPSQRCEEVSRNDSPAHFMSSNNSESRSRSLGLTSGSPSKSRLNAGNSQDQVLEGTVGETICRKDSVKEHIPLTKEELEKVYQYMTTREIAARYGYGLSTIQKKIRQFGIRSIQTPRELLRQKLTAQQREFLLGSMFGDGGCEPPRDCNHCAFYVSHSEKQLSYLMWKKQILAPFVIDASCIPKAQKLANGKGKFYQFKTRRHPAFDYYRSMFYLSYEGKGKKMIPSKVVKHLTPFALAVWICDDGLVDPMGRLRIVVGKYQGENMLAAAVNHISKTYDVAADFRSNTDTAYIITMTKADSAKLLGKLREAFPPPMVSKFFDLESSETIRRPDTVLSDDIVRSPRRLGGCDA